MRADHLKQAMFQPGRPARSKNSINQVAVHELKITQHGFAVRPCSCPLCHYCCCLTLAVFLSLCCILQENRSSVHFHWPDPLHKVCARYSLSLAVSRRTTLPNPRRRCLYPVSAALLWLHVSDVWIRRQMGNVAETPQPALVIELSLNRKTPRLTGEEVELASGWHTIRTQRVRGVKFQPNACTATHMLI